MSLKGLGPGVREQAELQYVELVGRLYACEYLENEFEAIQDHRVLYGWNLLTQEVLIRLSEASLKLLHMLDSNRVAPRGHSLATLWERLPQRVKDEVQMERETSPDSDSSVSFGKYNTDDFQDVRYSAERRAGGQQMMFEHRRLYLDSLAVVSVARKWLGEITTWPWAGLLDVSLKDYQVIPLGGGRFDVWSDNPIHPMDWAGAIIEANDDKYIWTLCFGFTDKEGNKRGFRVESLYYPWPLKYLLADSVEDAVEKIHKAYEEPCPALTQAIELATREMPSGDAP